jgi:hypothetical protein
MINLSNFLVILHNLMFALSILTLKGQLSIGHHLASVFFHPSLLRKLLKKPSAATIGPISTKGCLNNPLFIAYINLVCDAGS